MSFLEKAIRRGLSEGVGKAVGGAIEKAVAPKAEKFADRLTQQLDQATQTVRQQTTQSVTQQTAQTTSGLNGAFASLQKAAEGYATEMSKNMKICPACGEPAGADKKFCPSCGAKLPEETLAQGAVCPSCGLQNVVGTKFCTDCGAKLPSALQEEAAAQAADAAVMAEWDAKLADYPRWELGGTDYRMDDDGEHIWFTACYPNAADARGALRQYCETLGQSGFRPEGRYASAQSLYKKVNGVCRHVSTDMAFEGDDSCPTICFDAREPEGGFNYVKPEPKKAPSFLDLFK